MPSIKTNNGLAEVHFKRAVDYTFDKMLIMKGFAKIDDLLLLIPVICINIKKNKSHVDMLHTQHSECLADFIKIALYSCRDMVHVIRCQIDITTNQIRKIKADTSLCLFANELL